MESIEPLDENASIKLIGASYPEQTEPMEFPVMRASNFKVVAVLVVLVLFVGQFIFSYTANTIASVISLPTDDTISGKVDYQETDQTADAVKELENLEKARQSAAYQLNAVRKQMASVEKQIKETAGMITAAGKSPLAKLGVSIRELDKRLKELNKEKDRLTTESRNLQMQMRELEVRARDVSQSIPQGR